MEKHKAQAIKLLLGGLALGTTIGIGNAWHDNHLKNNNKLNIYPSNEMGMTKVYSPLSYLEIKSKGEYIEKISQKSSLNNSLIIGFELNSKGKVERMIEDYSLFGKQEIRISSPEKDKTVDWSAINKTAQKYIAHFERR